MLSDEVVVPLPWGRRFNEVGISELVWNVRIGAAPHGFSSNGRDLAAECSHASREACEPGLARMNTNSIEPACRRTDVFER